MVTNLRRPTPTAVFLPSSRTTSVELGLDKFVCLIRSWGLSITLVWVADERCGTLSNGDDT